jgi:hypothetical protein
MGIAYSFQHQWWHAVDKYDLSNTFRAMTADIASDFPAARGMADVDRMFYVEHFDERCEVVSVGVHFIASAGLA